jgi:hypothetical protein
MRNVANLIQGLAGLILATLLLAACGQTNLNSPQPSNNSASLQAASAVSGDTPGISPATYSTILKPRDFQPQFIEAAPILKNYFGRWELKFTDANRFELALNNRLMVEGDYQLTTDQIYFNSSTSWPSLCPDNQDQEISPETATGAYRWSLDGTSLQFFGTDTPCSVRGLVFSHTWELTGS